MTLYREEQERVRLIEVPGYWTVKQMYETAKVWNEGSNIKFILKATEDKEEE